MKKILYSFLLMVVLVHHYPAYAQYNTNYGSGAGTSLTSGTGNAFYGYQAGYFEGGSNKLYISNSSTSSSPLIYGDFSKKSISIGYKYTGSAYKLYVPGTIYANSVYSPSDKQFKQNIQNVVNPLEKINALHGVTYEFKSTKNDSTSRQLPEGNQYGLIAQDVKAVLPELVLEDEEGYLSVNYTGMIPVLVEAIKALQNRRDSVEALRQQLQTLQQENLEIKQQLADIKSMLGGRSVREGMGQGALYQNEPNPTQQLTSIPYAIPQNTREASLIIRNLLGEEMLRVDQLTPGQGKAEISTAGLPHGTYIYSLIADGKLIDSKKMVVR